MHTFIAATIGLVLAAVGTWLLTSADGPSFLVSGGVLVSVGGCLMVLAWLRLRWIAVVPYAPAPLPSDTAVEREPVPVGTGRAAAG